jgi:hypothetical protein
VHATQYLQMMTGDICFAFHREGRETENVGHYSGMVHARMSGLFGLMTKLPPQTLLKFGNNNFWSLIWQPMGLPNYCKEINKIFYCEKSYRRLVSNKMLTKIWKSIQNSFGIEPDSP